MIVKVFVISKPLRDALKTNIVGVSFSTIKTLDELTKEVNQIIEKISNNPRKILGLKNNSIEEGNNANITIFNPKTKWKFKEEDIISKSKNSPFIGEELKGKALAIYNNNRFKEL